MLQKFTKAMPKLSSIMQGMVSLTKKAKMLIYYQQTGMVQM